MDCISPMNFSYYSLTSYSLFPGDILDLPSSRTISNVYKPLLVDEKGEFVKKFLSNINIKKPIVFGILYGATFSNPFLVYYPRLLRAFFAISPDGCESFTKEE